jgi:hypothetical protein
MTLMIETLPLRVATSARRATKPHLFFQGQFCAVTRILQLPANTYAHGGST